MLRWGLLAGGIYCVYPLHAGLNAVILHSGATKLQPLGCKTAVKAVWKFCKQGGDASFWLLALGLQPFVLWPYCLLAASLGRLLRCFWQLASLS